jgi:hypothetical protein
MVAIVWSTLTTVQPMSAATLYFRMSDRYPSTLTWRPLVPTPPSHSIAMRVSGRAQSNRQSLPGQNRNSEVQLQPRRISSASSLLSVVRRLDEFAEPGRA